MAQTVLVSSGAEKGIGKVLPFDEGLQQAPKKAGKILGSPERFRPPVSPTRLGGFLSKVWGAAARASMITLLIEVAQWQADYPPSEIPETYSLSFRDLATAWNWVYNRGQALGQQLLAGAMEMASLEPWDQNRLERLWRLLGEDAAEARERASRGLWPDLKRRSRPEGIAAIQLPFVDTEHVFDLTFIQEERQRAANKPTVVFDLDYTLMVSHYGPPNWDDTTATYTVNPAFFRLLPLLQAEGFRLVLWTGSSEGRVQAFFSAHPEWIPFFDLIITARHYLLDEKSPTNPVRLAFAHYGHGALLQAGANGEEIAERWRYRQQTFWEKKDIALLGHRLLVDDFPHQPQYGQNSVFGNYPVITVPFGGNLLDDLHDPDALLKEILQKVRK